MDIGELEFTLLLRVLNFSLIIEELEENLGFANLTQCIAHTILMITLRHLKCWLGATHLPPAFKRQ